MQRAFNRDDVTQIFDTNGERINIGISRSQNVIYIVIALKRITICIWLQPFYYPYYSVPTSSAIAEVETRKWPFKVD